MVDKEQIQREIVRRFRAKTETENKRDRNGDSDRTEEKQKRRQIRRETKTGRDGRPFPTLFHSKDNLRLLSFFSLFFSLFFLPELLISSLKGSSCTRTIFVCFLCLFLILSIGIFYEPSISFSPPHPRPRPLLLPPRPPLLPSILSPPNSCLRYDISFISHFSLFPLAPRSSP